MTTLLQSPSTVLDESYSQRCTAAVLSVLEDKNSEVQNLGVTWYVDYYYYYYYIHIYIYILLKQKINLSLGALVKKCKEQHLYIIIDRLVASNDASAKSSEEMRDVSTTGKFF